MTEQEPRYEIEQPAKLPTPCEGIAGEIISEVLQDRASFIQKALSNFENENPHLAKIVRSFCMASPEPETSLRWTLVYYEIYSRSARKTGAGMPVVSKRTIQSTADEDINILTKLKKKDPEAKIEFKRERNSQRENLFDKEIAENDELLNFWSMVEAYLAKQFVLTGRQPAIVMDTILSPLYHVQEMLHSQVEANRMANEWRWD